MCCGKMTVELMKYGSGSFHTVDGFVCELVHVASLYGDYPLAFRLK